MIQILLLLLSLLTPQPAQAQCNGLYPANSVCGTIIQGAPGPVPSINFPISIQIGVTPVVGGTDYAILDTTSQVLQQVSSGPNCIFLTNSSNVPSCSTTLANTLTLTTSNNSLILNQSGYSVSGANSTNGVSLSGQFNTSGTPIGFLFNIIDTSGTTGESWFDFQKSGTSLVKLTNTTASTPGLVLSVPLTTNITGGGTQCIQASNAGVLSGTGSGCITSLAVGTTSVSGGSSGCVMFDTSSSKLGCDTSFTYAGSGTGATMVGAAGSTALTITGGTQTTNISALNITQTWNASGTTFDAPLVVNVTATASHAASVIADFQLSGANGGGFVKDGTVVSGFAPGGFFHSASEDNNGTVATYGVLFDGSAHIDMYTGSQVARFNVVSGVSLGLGGCVAFQTSSPDNAICRDSAATFDFGNGTAGDKTGTLNAAHANLNALANSATTSAVCYNTGTGALTYDGTIGTCNTSSLRFKHDVQPLIVSDSDPLAAVMRMKPISFFYNSDMRTPGEQVGLAAENLASIDPRLVSFDDEGNPHSLRIFAIISYLTAALQQQQNEINALRAR